MTDNQQNALDVLSVSHMPEEDLVGHLTAKMSLTAYGSVKKTECMEIARQYVGRGKIRHIGNLVYNEFSRQKEMKKQRKQIQACNDPLVQRAQVKVSRGEGWRLRLDRSEFYKSRFAGFTAGGGDLQRISRVHGFVVAFVFVRRPSHYYYTNRHRCDLVMVALRDGVRVLDVPKIMPSNVLPLTERADYDSKLEPRESDKGVYHIDDAVTAVTAWLRSRAAERSPYVVNLDLEV